MRQASAHKSKARAIWVSLYFLIMGAGAVVFFGFMAQLGNSLSAMSASSSHARGSVQEAMWTVGAYCGCGVLAGLFRNSFPRRLLAIAAHLIPIIIFIPRNTFATGNGSELISGLLDGGILCAMLALPFGIPWLYFARRRVRSNVSIPKGRASLKSRVHAP
jgi:hypothetical protein